MQMTQKTEFSERFMNAITTNNKIKHVIVEFL